MKCWICEKPIEEGEKVIDLKYRVAVMFAGSLETTINVTPSVIHNNNECKTNALNCITQYWDVL